MVHWRGQAVSNWQFAYFLSCYFVSRPDKAVSIAPSGKISTRPRATKSSSADLASAFETWCWATAQVTILSNGKGDFAVAPSATSEKIEALTSVNWIFPCLWRPHCRADRLHIRSSLAAYPIIVSIQMRAIARVAIPHWGGPCCPSCSAITKCPCGLSGRTK